MRVHFQKLDLEESLKSRRKAAVLTDTPEKRAIEEENKKATVQKRARDKEPKGN
jgi:hypothetical protein